MEILRSLLALLAGGIIGLVFGLLQNLALRRNERRQQLGQLGSGWAVMPGSAKRVATLLVALALVQIVCPLLFIGGGQGFLSIGVVFGFGFLFFLPVFLPPTPQPLARPRLVPPGPFPPPE